MATKKRLQVWIDADLAESLQLMADEQDRSVSNLVASYMRTAVGVWARARMALNLQKTLLPGGPSGDDTLTRP